MTIVERSPVAIVIGVGKPWVARGQIAGDGSDTLPRPSPAYFDVDLGWSESQAAGMIVSADGNPAANQIEKYRATACLPHVRERRPTVCVGMSSLSQRARWVAKIEDMS